MRAQLSSAHDVLSMRTRYREEMNCQVVYDSIHRRPGWTVTYQLELETAIAGFGSVALEGPWKDRPTLFEFYVLPEFRLRAFELFESLLAVTRAQFIEIQSNDVLCLVMAHTFGRDIVSEKIVFRDGSTTTHSSQGAVLRRVTLEEEAKRCMDLRGGSNDWTLELDGTPIGKGGFAFHYNRPYADVYMEIDPPYRGRGFATYLVQELKRECYAMGAVPASRCSPGNTGSRRTLQRAGFIPFAHILVGSLSSKSE